MSAIEGEGVGLIGHGGTKKEKEKEEEEIIGVQNPKRKTPVAPIQHKNVFAQQEPLILLNVSASGHAHASHLFTKLGELAFGSQSRDHSPTVALEYTGDCGGIPTS